MKFTKEHEWVRQEGNLAVVGISDYAQEALGDVVFVELPTEGTIVTMGNECCVLESVKAASEVYSPINGEVIEINEALVDNPELVNTDPYGNGWFFKIVPSDWDELDQLMTEEEYQEFIT